MSYLHVHMHSLGVQRLVCGLLPWQLCPYLCCCQFDSLLYDVDTFSLIVHRGIFSEHFCVIELLGNSAHEVEVAQSDMPAIMWTTWRDRRQNQSSGPGTSSRWGRLRSAVKLNSCRLLNLPVGNVCSFFFSFFAALRATPSINRRRWNLGGEAANLIDGWTNTLLLVSCSGVHCQTHQRPQVFVWRLVGRNLIRCCMLN